jgi:hypothetical protein
MLHQKASHRAEKPLESPEESILTSLIGVAKSNEANKGFAKEWYKRREKYKADGVP